MNRPPWHGFNKSEWDCLSNFEEDSTGHRTAVPLRLIASDLQEFLCRRKARFFQLDGLVIAFGYRRNGTFSYWVLDAWYSFAKFCYTQCIELDFSKAIAKDMPGRVGKRYFAGYLSKSFATHVSSLDEALSMFNNVQ